LEDLKGTGRSEDLGVGGENNIVDLREMGWEGVGCVHLAQDMDPWWALV